MVALTMMRPALDRRGPKALVERVMPDLVAGQRVDGWTRLVSAQDCTAVIHAVEVSLDARCSDEEMADHVRRLLAIGAIRSSPLSREHEDALKLRVVEFKRVISGAPRGCVAEAVDALVQTLEFIPKVAELVRAIDAASNHRRLIVGRARSHLKEWERRRDEAAHKERIRLERQCPGLRACTDAIVEKALAGLKSARPLGGS